MRRFHRINEIFLTLLDNKVYNLTLKFIQQKHLFVKQSILRFLSYSDFENSSYAEEQLKYLVPCLSEIIHRPNWVPKLSILYAIVITYFCLPVHPWLVKVLLFHPEDIGNTNAKMNSLIHCTSLLQIIYFRLSPIIYSLSIQHRRLLISICSEYLILRTDDFSKYV
ncbi:hypothetical protein BDC45DRAFT_540255 [Circinella umbellata]|nr:hypothetical protein BDC45DRAFT_540255 [Circinella umbellata]